MPIYEFLKEYLEFGRWLYPYQIHIILLGVPLVVILYRRTTRKLVKFLLVLITLAVGHIMLFHFTMLDIEAEGARLNADPDATLEDFIRFSGTSGPQEMFLSIIGWVWIGLYFLICYMIIALLIKLFNYCKNRFSPITD